MRSLTLQHVILIAIVVLAPLLNLALRWLQRRMNAAEPVSPAPEPPGPPPLLPPPAQRREPLPTAERPRAAAPAAPPGRRPRRSGSLGSLPEVRRAVVMMTILGPCRALEAPTPAGTDRAQAGPAPRRRT